MRKQLIKIDGLLCVLLISIATLYSFSDSIQKNLLGEESVLKKFQLLKDIAHLPDSDHSNLFLFDQYFEMTYSVNGGDTYIKTDNLTQADIYLLNLSHYVTSFRSKPVFGNQPEMKSVLIKAKHKSKDIFVEPTMVTFPIQNKHELPIISIVSSEKGLFSSLGGILNLGQGAWIDEGYYKSFWNKNANYKKRGDLSKRKSTWQYIVNGEVKFTVQSDFQVSGNATRSFPQKSFKLKAHKLYGSEVFNYPFFGDKGLKKYTSLVVRNSGNDNTRTLFADMLMHKLARKMQVLTQRGKAIVLYINGNYWGIYNLRERLDIYMIANKEKAKPDEVTILEGGTGELKDGDLIEAKGFIELIDSIEKMNDQAKFKIVEKQIDLPSFIDYILLETFYGNGDWLHNNALWYKVKGKKWKWILNDLDYALAYQGAGNLNTNYFDYLKKSQTINARLFNYLILDNHFKKIFKLRARKIIETHFTDGKINKAFDKKKSKILTEMKAHLNRWRGHQTFEDWEKSVEENRFFLKNRKAVFLGQIENL